jgi:hypothetical protein
MMVTPLLMGAAFSFVIPGNEVMPAAVESALSD